MPIIFFYPNSFLSTFKQLTLSFNNWAQNFWARKLWNLEHHCDRPVLYHLVICTYVKITLSSLEFWHEDSDRTLISELGGHKIRSDVESSQAGRYCLTWPWNYATCGRALTSAWLSHWRISVRLTFDARATMWQHCAIDPFSI